MKKIEPQLDFVESFLVSGLSVRTKNSEEFTPNTAKLPTLWQQFWSSGIQESLLSLPAYGVYSDYESDETGSYKVTAGVKSNQLANFPEWASVTIQSGKYLVFANKGPMPQVVVDTWKQIWSYFSNTTLYKRNFISDYEVYYNVDEIAIYIGIYENS